MGSDLDFNPAAAQLDGDTENELYALYRAYFAKAEETRLWNVWNDIPWTEGADAEPSDELVNAVLAAYSAELYLPEYLTVLLKHTRSSRARSWYVTHWSYEEGKHLLALGEWLAKRELYTETELQERGSEAIADVRWEPPSIDAIALYVDAIIYEEQEAARYRTVRELAVAGNDNALVTICDKILVDEAAQREYFVQALQIIQKRYAGRVADAIEIVSAAQPDAASAKQTLTAYIAE